MTESSHLRRSGGAARLSTGLVAGKYSVPSIAGVGQHHITPDKCKCSCEGGEGAGAGGGKVT
jgi:hypothetical protein